MAALCSNCSAPVPDGAKFCGECGTPMIARCAACGAAAAQAGQKFCLECGVPLTARAPPVSGVVEALRVERRLVSVLFADLTGFTSFSEGRDAEDVREMLSEYFELCRRIIGAYGGRVEKFIGDAVMALWGAPVANEDDAERAVRAALDLVAGVTTLGDGLGVELRLRAGVLTGEAAVELDAVAEGLVVGDAINTASRIQSVAEPGSVLVDDVTRGVTSQAIAYDDAGSHAVKGKTEPVHTWRALRVISVVGGAGRMDLELPLVGRDAAIGTLRRALDTLIESPKGLQLVSVVGDPGLGKSRLAWEFEKYLDGIATVVLWHHGQALSFGRGVGFAALAEMVRGRARISLDEPMSVQRSKLETLVHEVFESADADVREHSLRGLSRLLGLDDSQELIDLGELYTAWRLLFERLAARSPVVMLFEDLHWADQGLFDFIAHLCEWASRSQILVLVFSRPDERLDAVTGLGERIELTPLSTSEIEQLVAGAVDGAPTSLLASVGEHAAGVPLFAVESLRMLADRGVMVAEGDAHRYRLIGEVDDLDVPPSIHALVAARLDRLGDRERVIMRGGAVLGQRFASAAAAAMAGITMADAQSLLDGLVSKQFLALDTDPRSQSRGTFTFVHRQVQRVVLSTLSRRELKSRHLAAVELLARQAATADLPGILAGHLVAAYEAQPTAPDASEIRARALTLTLEAAERAERVGALNEAVALFAQAAQIETDDLRAAEHFVRAARCAERYGDQESIAAGHYASARELHEQAGRTRDALRLRARELCVYSWSRPPAELMPPLREVYEALGDQRDAAFADAAVALAIILYADGNAEQAENVAAQAAAAAEDAAAHKELGLALNIRASALIELARPVEALPLFQEALAIWEHSAPSEVPVSLGNIAITFAALGRFEEAATAGRQAMAASERAASRVNRNLAALQLARAQFSLGSWDEALTLVAEAAPETAVGNRGMVIGPPLLVAIHRGEVAHARAVIDDFDEAEAETQAAFESDYRSLREVALACLADDRGEAAAVIERAQTGDYAEWPTWLPLAVDVISRAPDDRPLRAALGALELDGVPTTSPIVTAQTARLQALLAHRAGDLAGAAQHWRAAIDAARGARMAFDEAALKLELYEHLPESDGASEGLRLAAETFTRVQATPWLERAQRARAASPPGRVAARAAQ